MSNNGHKEINQSELFIDELESIVEETLPEDNELMALAKVEASVDAEEMRQLVIKNSHYLDERHARELNVLVLQAPSPNNKFFHLGILGGISFDSKRKLSRILEVYSTSKLRFLPIEPMLFEFLMREAYEVRNLVKVETRKNQQTTRSERVWGKNKTSGEKPSNSTEARLEDLKGQRFDISNLDEYYEIIRKMEADEFDENELDTLSFIRFVLQDFLLSGGSDFHLEAFRSGGRLRYRYLGIPYTRISHIPLYKYSEIANGLCSLAGKDPSRMKYKGVKSVIKVTMLLEGEIKDIELRFQSMSSLNAPKIILRGQAKPLKNINQVGFLPEHMVDIEKAINSRHGIVVITGPTGSGKTNTLNTFFTKLEEPDDKVIYELGSPIEIESDKRIQITIPDIDDEKKQEAVYLEKFNDCLRADPDVVAFTEIRTRSEARITFRAAISGHLVFTTLHAADVEETITTILNWQIDRADVAKGILAIVSQTLVRTLCDCKVLDEEASQIAGFSMYKANENGCESCSNGFNSRTAVAEVLYFTEEIQKMIIEGFPPSEIAEKAVESGLMIPMKSVAFRKLSEGITSHSEVVKLVEWQKELKMNSTDEIIIAEEIEETDLLPVQEAEYVDVQTVA